MKENQTNAKNTDVKKKFDAEAYRKKLQQDFLESYLLQVEIETEREKEDEILSQMTEEEQIEYIWQQEQEMNKYIDEKQEKIFKDTAKLTKKDEK